MLDNHEVENTSKGDVVLKITLDESVDFTVTSEITSPTKVLSTPNNNNTQQNQRNNNGWLDNMLNLLRKNNNNKANNNDEIFDTRNTDATLGDTFNNDDIGCHAEETDGETLQSNDEVAAKKGTKGKSSSPSKKLGQLESLWNSVIGNGAVRKKNRKLKQQQQQKELFKQRPSLIRKRAGSDSSSSSTNQEKKDQFEINSMSPNGLMEKLATREAMIVSQSSSKSLEKEGVGGGSSNSSSPLQQLRRRPSLQVSSLVLKQDEEPFDSDYDDDESLHNCSDISNNTNNSSSSPPPPPGGPDSYKLSDDIPLLFDLENEVSTWQQDLDKFME